MIALYVWEIDWDWFDCVFEIACGVVQSDIFEMTSCNHVCGWYENVWSGQTTFVWPKTKSLMIFE